MADDHGVAAQDSGMDYAEHERTYALFTTLVKNGAIVVALILVALAYFTL